MITTSQGLSVKAHTLKLLTDKKVELYNITQKVKDFVKSTSIRDGFSLITSLHTTTALFVNEVQSALLDDIKTILHKVGYEMITAGSTIHRNIPIGDDIMPALI